MITIGNQTSFTAATPAEPFDYALSKGFDAFEWFPDKHEAAGWDPSELAGPLRAQLRERARAAGMRISVHARLEANPVRPERQGWLREDLELAQDLGAVLFNLHLFHEAGVPAFVEASLPLVRLAAEAGLVLTIENTPCHAPEVFNALFDCLRGQASMLASRVGMCLDLGHANLCAATHNDYLGFVDRLGPQVPILHLHLHENWGDADSHLPLFTGPSAQNESGLRGLIERLRARNFSGSIILEQWPQPPSLLDTARDRLRQMLGTAARGAGRGTSVEGRGNESPPPDPRHSPLDPIGSNLTRRGAPVLGRSIARPRTARDNPRFTPSNFAAPEDGRTPHPEEFTEALVAGDRRCRSWREKLDWVRDRLAQEARPLTLEELVDVAVYLRFLGTGEIPCAEDGRHFRPAHHARIALEIQERLARLGSPAEVFIARKIYPWLPSAAEPFQRAEPLTRIRAIAHRNDIPPDLKRELKHSLQNKLHRCAGPEDLVTATAILERITGPGAHYSAAFVEQFKTFHEELKEFFNARSLDERLNALLPKVGEGEADLIRAFLSQKAGTSLPVQARALTALTALRRQCLAAVEKRPSLERPEFLLADIGLEDFAFALLSRMINELERQDGAGDSPGLGLEANRPVGRQDARPTAGESAGYTRHPPLDTRPSPLGPPPSALLDTLLLTLVNLALSSVEPEECRAIQSELGAWMRGFCHEDREQLLRLKATADRVLRLTEEHSQRILALLPPRVEKLGRALGVAEPAIRAFCEAEIRGQLIFQVSKLGAQLLRRLRAELRSPPWDVLVSGQAVGRVRAVQALEELGEVLPEAVMAVLNRAEGDEEIPKGVAGIVLAHDLPHLSHLGIRARQAGVVFVACEETAVFDELKALEGQVISCTATPEEVAWTTAGGPAPTRVEGRQAHIPPARLAPKPACLALEQAAPDSCGGKAAGARRLAELAVRTGAGFKTPPAWVVPFGVLEAGLRAAPEVEAKHRRLREEINRMAPEQFAAATQELRELIGQVAVPAEVAAMVGRHFKGRDRLMVRSSANGEDLAELAGAGLYDSIANVAPAEVASAVRAVWSSLWTRRAALSRKQAGIPHDQAHIAVLIQLMLSPDLSFVLHTVNPLNGNARELYAEVAVGLGETLASGATRGNPYRFVCDKESGTLRTLAFASFSQALRPAAAGGISRETVDYSRIPLSCNAVARKELGGRLARIGRQVEQAFEGPQDIEGALVGRDIYLVQARPQPGLKLDS
ncbi:MAG TPA: PEP/pyruvate-binding domain-containing protein [Dongiaceae bacterium]|nr:PEP/pyruvate-binding domain-containing protein [Dongiaceae bacterium]